MSAMGDKIKGTVNEATGKVKQAAGDLAGDDQLKAEGKLQEIGGKTQKAVGKGKDALKDAIDDV